MVSKYVRFRPEHIWELVWALLEIKNFSKIFEITPENSIFYALNNDKFKMYFFSFFLIFDGQPVQCVQWGDLVASRHIPLAIFFSHNQDFHMTLACANLNNITSRQPFNACVSENCLHYSTFCSDLVFQSFVCSKDQREEQTRQRFLQRLLGLFNTMNLKNKNLWLWPEQRTSARVWMEKKPIPIPMWNNFISEIVAVSLQTKEIIRTNQQHHNHLEKTLFYVNWDRTHSVCSIYQRLVYHPYKLNNWAIIATRIQITVFKNGPSDCSVIWQKRISTELRLQMCIVTNIELNIIQVKLSTKNHICPTFEKICYTSSIYLHEKTQFRSKHLFLSLFTNHPNTFAKDDVSNITCFQALHSFISAVAKICDWGKKATSFMN